MRVIKAKYPDGSPLYSAIPTTTSDLYRIFSVYGIHAMVVKILGKYDICYPGPKEAGGPIFFTVSTRTIQDFTAKRWLEIADKNCPDRNRGEKDILWTNYKQYIEKETL